MKYLIDGYKKQVGSLAHQYKFLRQGDEFRVWGAGFFNLDGVDFLETTDVVRHGDTYEMCEHNDGDTRRFKYVADFDKALAWCDCYVTFENLPYIMSESADLDKAQNKVDRILSHIEQAKQAGKKIYLGDMFCQEYEDVIRNYDGCLNHLITKADLDAILEYGTAFEATGQSFPAKVTMIVGTTSSAGKFSCAMQAKQMYEAAGERVVLVHTEESYPFLDDQDGTIVGFCRNFSTLTTDEDLVYLQCFIAKIADEKRPDRIIFCSQSGFGLHGIVTNYQDSANGKKMKGVWDELIVGSFGLDSMIIATCYNTIPSAERIITYCDIRDTSVDAMFVSPITYAGGEVKVLREDGTYFFTAEKGDSETVQLMCQGLSLRYPGVPILCNYDDISAKVVAFRNSKYYGDTVAALYAQDLISEVTEILAGHKKLMDDAINVKYAEYAASYADKEIFERARAVIEAERAKLNDNSVF